MKQLSLLKIRNDCTKDTVYYWKLFVDGASRNNPGPAGAGVFVLRDEKEFYKAGYFLGKKTNNQAEYLALLLGIFYIRKNMCPEDLIVIVSDSLLLVKQLKGEYRVKNGGLKPLYSLAKKLLEGLNVSLTHVLREENKEADEQANNGVDHKHKVPQDFLDLLQSYDISI